MKKSDLYREWARVLDMCEGTKVNLKSAWKFKSYPQSDRLPNFENNHPDHYLFAVEILEDKPVFVGDKVWCTYLNRFVEVKNATQIKLLVRDGQAAWQPPKKTFMLNGEELPCPSKFGKYGFQLGVFALHCFETQNDCTKVLNFINKLLKDATK